MARIIEDPLHIQVAKALGVCVEHSFEDERPEKHSARCRHCGQREPMEPWQNTVLLMDEPPRYDTDWAVTGPLIEKHNISITSETYCSPPSEYRWSAQTRPTTEVVWGSTPLIAVCNLILALEGKLE